jgi:hypothetical protein
MIFTLQALARGQEPKELAIVRQILRFGLDQISVPAIALANDSEPSQPVEERTVDADG